MFISNIKKKLNAKIIIITFTVFIANLTCVSFFSTLLKISYFVIMLKFGYLFFKLSKYFKSFV